VTFSLPPVITAKLNELQQTLDPSVIRKAHEKLSERYRAGEGTETRANRQTAMAYALARLPATYAALKFVLIELKKHVAELETVLDFGAGPGMSVWALQETFLIKTFSLIEQNSAMVGLGQRLLQEYSGIHWHKEDMRQVQFSFHDLALMSYSLGELEEKAQALFLQKAWYAAKKAIVIVEPGTPKGFNTILKARDLLIKEGAHIAAPCPHNKPCPLLETDWCHFSISLPRSSSHRALKGGSLMREDEKFSYVVALKESLNAVHSRVIKPPLRCSGHVILDFCTQDGIKRSTFGKKDPLYRQARALNWGDEFDQ